MVKFEGSSERIVKMLTSVDEEIQDVGALTAAAELKSWDQYNEFRLQKGYKDIPSRIRKALRKNMVAIYGAPAPHQKKRYKTW